MLKKYKGLYAGEGKREYWREYDWVGYLATSYIENDWDVVKQGRTKYNICEENHRGGIHFRELAILWIKNDGTKEQTFCHFFSHPEPSRPLKAEAESRGVWPDSERGRIPNYGVEGGDIGEAASFKDKLLGMILRGDRGPQAKILIVMDGNTAPMSIAQFIHDKCLQCTV